MDTVHHRPLPDYSTLLSGRGPIPDDFGFRSGQLQVWYNNTAVPWHDERPHAHRVSDECFIVLKGKIVVEVEGKEHVIGPREYCYFPPGVMHRIARVEPPVESFAIRAPSIEDKIYE